MTRFLGTAIVFVALVAPVAAQSRVLDLVPADAAGALIIRGIDDLRKKGDKFVADTKTENLGRPSQLFDGIFNHLGIRGGVDGKLPTGIIMANPNKAGTGQINLGTLDQLLVLAVPYSDLDALSASFGFKPGQLTNKLMSKGKGQNFGTHFYVDGRYLYIGNNARAIESVVKQEPLAKGLDDEQMKLLGDTDFMLMLNKQAWDDTWRLLVGDIERQIIDSARDDEKAILREVAGSLHHLRHIILSVRIDGGMGGSLLTVFTPHPSPSPQGGEGTGVRGKHDNVQKLLARLRGSGVASSLAGLPDGNVLAAQALQGDGTQNTAVVKALLSLLFQSQPARLFANYAHRPNIIGVFTELLHQLKGIRFAIYQNPLASGVGHLGAVAILETDNPARFLNDIKDLAKFADSDNFDLTSRASVDNVTALRKLVADLGSNYYRAREAAMVRLSLVGERALPFLDDAAKSNDLEVSQRARRLQEQILATASQRRKELLSDDIFKRIKPRLAFSPKTDAWRGQDIYSAFLKLDDARLVEAQMQEVLGPEWNRLRFAVHGKQVAVLVGSNQELLRDTLANLQENKPGLAQSTRFAGFTANSNPRRNFEIHVAARAVTSLITPTPLKERALIAANDAPTSLSMTVGAESIQINLWVPPEEFALFWKVFQ